MSFSFSSLLGFSSSTTNQNEVSEIYKLGLKDSEFIKSDTLNMFIKILTDTIERTSNIPDKIYKHLWDSCLYSQGGYGLISYLADAMERKADLFLVYKEDVVRIADELEKKQIIEDYKLTADSKVGIYVSFKNYHRTDLFKIYSLLEYYVLCSLNKSLNLSKALQIKVNDLRSSVSLGDAQIAIDQAKNIASALGSGNDVIIDVKDMIETATPDTSAAEKALDFLDGKKASLLSLPLSYIDGEQTTGIGSTGEADTKAVERGLKGYFLSIIQPVMKALFNIDCKFQSHDFRQITASLEVLKTFDLIDDETLPKKYKEEIISRMYGISLDDFTKEVEKMKKEFEKAKPIQVQNQFVRNDN